LDGSINSDIEKRQGLRRLSQNISAFTALL
jgi:hypothetical protein